MLNWLKKFSCKGVTLSDTFQTRYNLKLATLMVTDEKDRGLPAAMPDFEPSKVVTDGDPCFNNGFRAVFPEANTSLLQVPHPADVETAGK
ncbi:unnamed protein product [Nippostrongylus brasiliensis]|uniref:DDE-1 domain-containing protein n=1 Tax=Nippostrongylus brasiliensis TaxID=27835 RepID=A0A0N4XYP4_NIPBR|nr:unnamed protein product [Nippostrongylus brasiliensis]